VIGNSFDLQVYRSADPLLRLAGCGQSAGELKSDKVGAILLTSAQEAICSRSGPAVKNWET
jgi:hypothetical protein